MPGRLDDTICAVATPVGEGGIGIVRVSGSSAVSIGAQVVVLRSGKGLQVLESHRLAHADLVDIRARGSLPPVFVSGGGHRWVDEALVVVMRAPRSYTGEDVLELHCHGGTMVLQELCQGLVQAGARMAEPGEFTKRAFLNGRLDLTQAEAVLDTIKAKTASSLYVAQAQLRGRLSEEVQGLRERLIGLLAQVEAGIDFTEEDIEFIERDALRSGLQTVQARVGQMIERGREGRLLREGLTMAIVGRPNVGKSSLLNALLQTDRAIVTAIPGTTRDVLEDGLNIGGLPVRVLDTAGVRDTDDPIEQEGVRRAKMAMEQADLLLIVLDGAAPLEGTDRELLELFPDKKRVLVINKCDLPQVLEATGLQRESDGKRAPLVTISATTGSGLDELKLAIRSCALQQQLEPREGVLVTRVRHLDALRRTQEAVGNALVSVEARAVGELIAMDVRAATDALGEITGAVTTDDILDRIFQEFCIGK